MKCLIGIMGLFFQMLVGVVTAQDGTPDNSFSHNGFALYSTSEEGHCAATDIHVDETGKLLLTGGGVGPDGKHQTFLMRLLSDGTEDPDFGENGLQFLPVSGFQTYGMKSILLPDGKILVLAGRNDNIENRIVVHRLHQDGTPDKTFGDDGLVVLDTGAYFMAARGFGLQSDGKIIIGGYMKNQAPAEPRFFLTRLLPDGDLDITFGDHGITFSGVLPDGSRAYAISIQTDDKIVITGMEMHDEFESMVTFRFQPDGTPDASFHHDGMTSTSISNAHARATSVMIQADGKIVLGGKLKYDNADADFIAVRMHPDGTPDHSFDGDGKAIISFTPYNDAANALSIQPDGKIVLAGLAQSNGPDASTTALVRLLPDGSPDLSFGIHGKVAFEAFPMLSEQLNAVALQHDGRIVGAGSMFNSINNRIYACRFVSEMTVSSNEVPNFIHSISVSPNPATSSIELQYHVDRDENLSIHLIDLQGRIMQTLQPFTSVPRGSHKASFGLETSIRQGMYVIQLIYSNKSQFIPIIINR